MSPWRRLAPFIALGATVVIIAAACASSEPTSYRRTVAPAPEPVATVDIYQNYRPSAERAIRAVARECHDSFTSQLIQKDAEAYSFDEPLDSLGYPLEWNVVLGDNNWHVSLEAGVNVDPDDKVEAGLANLTQRICDGY